MLTSKINLANNFDFLRLVLATLVIISHSFPLTNEREILAIITNGQVDMGSFAVNSFFVVSGYFIFISLQRSKTIQNYLWKRLLRLYPALITLMVFTLVVLPLIYTGSQLTYAIKHYYKYALGCLSLYNVQYYIPAVFENNPYKGSINGSLWSFSYEFTMYISLLFLFFIRKKNTSYILIGLVFFSAYFLHLFRPNFLQKIFQGIFLDSAQVFRLTAYFFAGSLLSFFDLTKINTLAIRIVLLIALYLEFYIIIAPLLLPILMLLLGSLKTPVISSLGERIGDISYGVYIYGFIVQQIIMNFLDINATLLMSLSIPITYFLAYLSWILVEERMMKYKNAF